jgi:CDP-diglyceride synthetase
LVLRQRLASAFIGVPLGLLLVWVGGLPLHLAVLILTALGAWELTKAMRRRRIAVLREIVLACPLALLMALPLMGGDADNFFRLWVIGLFVALFASLVGHILWRSPTPAEGMPMGWRIQSIGATVLSVLYLSLFAFPLLLRELKGRDGSELGRDALFLLLAILWATDATAYFVGTKLGRHPIVPQVSPGKTWEGSLAGIVGGVLAGAFITALLPFLPNGTVLTFRQVVPMAVVVSIVGQIGDLCESVLKRDLGIKDFSGLIPGHGGVLDRFDSLLITAPLVYFWALWQGR